MSSFHRIISGALALVILASCMHVAHAGNDSSYHRTLDRSIPVNTATRVTVENMVGSVEVVRGGGPLQVHASVVAGDSDQAAARKLAGRIRLDVTRRGNDVLVHVNYPVDTYTDYRYIPAKGTARHHGGMRILGFEIGHSSSSFTYQGRRVHVYEGKDEGVPLHVDLRVSMPAGSHLTVDNHVGQLRAEHVQGTLSMKTGSGNIDVQGMNGALTTRSGSGDVGISDVKGPLVVRTGSGDIKLDGVHGGATVSTGSGDIRGCAIHGDSLKLQTGSGDIHLADLAGNIEVRTGSGDIGLRGLASVASAQVKSGSGDIDLEGDLSGLKQFEIGSGSGDITLASANPPAVHLEIRGSDVGVHWPGLRNVESGRHHFRADIGDASGSGRIRTGSGDIVLRP